MAWVTAVQNGLGERIEYTLNDLGNITQEVVKSDTGAIKQTQSRTFDELGRLMQHIGASSQTTSFEYDPNSNVTEITDPLNGDTVQAFDALDRLTQVTDALNGVVGQDYDDQDNLTGVTDQRSLQTSYVYNGFGEVIEVDSPDTGVTVYEYDSAGNLTKETDARSVADVIAESLRTAQNLLHIAKVAINPTRNAKAVSEKERGLQWLENLRTPEVDARTSPATRGTHNVLTTCHLVHQMTFPPVLPMMCHLVR